MAKKKMKWDCKEFEFPEKVKRDWKEAGSRNIELSEEWEKQNASTLLNIKNIKDEFLNKLIDNSLRVKINEETKITRDTLVRTAMMSIKND